MEKRKTVLTRIVYCTVVTAVYFSSIGAPLFVFKRAESAVVRGNTRLEANPGDRYAQEANPPPAPPPPPPSRFPGGPEVVQSAPDPSRVLIGMSSSDLREIEQYLPERARVYTYPVGKSNLAAAVISNDLNGDKKDELIVIHKQGEVTTSLTLSVLTHERNDLKLRASFDLAGGVLFQFRVDGLRTFFTAGDITGDSRPEIIVAPGTGASVGGWLYVLSFDGSTLRELARIGGHFFGVRSKRAGKSALITARWNGEQGTRSYEWNGQTFEQTAKPLKASR